MKLLIACGNRLRQDDGAGLVFADDIAAYWQTQNEPFRMIQVQQLVPELALAIVVDEIVEVWFVDTRVAYDAEDVDVQIRRLSATPQSPTMGHQLSPELLLLYAGLFDERPQFPAWQVTVPGFCFGHAEMVSPACEAVLQTALAQFIGEMACA